MVRLNVWAQVRDQMGQASEHIRERVSEHIRERVSEHIWGQVCELRGRVFAQVWHLVRDQVRRGR